MSYIIYKSYVALIVEVLWRCVSLGCDKRKEGDSDDDIVNKI